MSFGGLIEIFNPGHRHLRDEMERKRVEAKIPGNEGEPNSVDLDKGIVRISLPARDMAQVQDARDIHDAPEPESEAPDPDGHST